MADERATPLNQGFDKWLQITDGGKLQTWNGVDSPAPIIGDDPLVTKTELDDKASLSLNHGYVSEYTSRVMQEGGTIQNGRRTAAPFISPTYEDAKIILNASGGLDIAEVDGRKVVDKIWDSSQEKNNPVFAGSDRPEFHKTLDGFEQVCVEKEGENFLPISVHKFDSGWSTAGGTVIESVTQNKTIPNLTDKATEIVISGDVTQSASRVYWTTELNIEDEYLGPSSLQCWVYNTGGNPVRLIGIRVGGVSTINTSEYCQPGEVKKLILQSDASSDGSKSFGFGFQDDLPGEFIAYQPQAEKSPYPTLFTEGTRLAPSPVIENALPETGSIITVLNKVNIGGSTAYGFRNTGSTQIGIQLTTASGSSSWYNSRWFWGGETFMVDIRDYYDGVQEFDRVDLLAGVSFGNNGGKFWFLFPDGSLLISDHNSDLDPSSFDLELLHGTVGFDQTSVRGYKPLIIEPFTTNNDDIKSMSERAVKGTPMEMSKEDMVIVE